MKHSGTRKLSALAAAIGLALGSGAALAQFDDGVRPNDAPQPQQPEFEPQPQQSDLGETSREIEDHSVDGDQQLSENRDENGDENRAAGHMGDLDKIAEDHSDLSTFVEAVKAAGLAESLTDGTSYTVFAPTNDAFEEEDMEELLKPENREDLVGLLRAHIVADDVDREMARTIGSAKTIDGGTIEIAVDEGDEEKLMVGDASVMDDEIEMGSVRIYRVDAVLAQNAPADDASPSAQNRSLDEAGEPGERTSRATTPAER